MIWRGIAGYEDYYQISSDGQVMSLSRNVAHRNYKRYVPEKILKQNTDKDGYKTITLYKIGIPKTYKIHRLVALNFIKQSDLVVNHIDGNKNNNTLSNLELVSIKENNMHARSTGLVKNIIKGDNHPMTKVLKIDKENFARLKKSGISVKNIALKHNIHEVTVYKILRKTAVN